MNKNQKLIMSHVMISIDPDAIITEDALSDLVNVFARLYPISETERSDMLSSLHAMLEIRMDRGACVVSKDHVPWYNSAKKDLKTDFWDRYATYLIKDAGFPPKVIASLDESTDEMMDLLGNPSGDKDFQRRGLVIGDVQSGKTATYTALINKASDAGYKVVILLTGTIEKLRKQTQGRLDEGFVGLDSTAFIRDKSKAFVGVGNINPSVSGWAVTSTTNDFNQATAGSLNGQLAGINSPILFVLKKNKSVLEKLERWLKVYNTNEVSQTSSLPMLLIDDEADNASVNTKSGDDPATINACIRKLLNLFSKANYVGFTATPFANIFIDPDSDHEMLKDDLFPSDFIYALEAPSNYVGARSIFSEEGSHSYMLKANDDCEDYLPEKHKKDFVPQDLPLSLRKAVVSFFICNAVRDLRGQTTKHRSMLVNVSRFIAVQEQIKKAVDGYVREFQREIKNYHLIGKEALNYNSFSFIKDVFNEEFSNIPDFEFTWDEIQEALHEAVASIVVRTVNGGNAAKNLNYDEYTEDGLRLIAIGGFSLSRGLTLEGLCVSYFYRNSKMYDTLMQMGRWFGYREGYADICQIWMGEGAIDWYRYISVAADELRREVRRMKEQNKTPKDFGLCVRSDINALLVTARNKMKTAKDYTMTVSLNGKVIETKYVYSDRSRLDHNLLVTEDWIKTLAKDGHHFTIPVDLPLKHLQALNVPKKYVSEYLAKFESHYLNIDFQTEALITMINDYKDGTVDNWDIVIASGKGPSGKLDNLDIKYVMRNFGIKKESKALQMSDTKSRLGSANFAKGGLTKDQVFEAELPIREELARSGARLSLAQERYFKGIKRNPLLVIYPVVLSPDTNNKSIPSEVIQDRINYASSAPKPIIGISVGIPEIEGRENKMLKYKVNLVMYKELFDIDDDFEEIDETNYQDEVING